MCSKLQQQLQLQHSSGVGGTNGIAKAQGAAIVLSTQHFPVRSDKMWEKF